MRKKIVFSLFVVVLAMMFTGCTGDNKVESKSSSENSNEIKDSGKNVSLNIDLSGIDDVKKSASGMDELIEGYKNIESGLNKNKENIEDKLKNNNKSVKNNTVLGHEDKVTGTLKELLNK
ncbi:hypothetical protein UT300003_22250 [Clostridium sardiniense]|uniref:hypothetical protein n=1 Tax=Clostridium sardiniense TaxID=29369 RepID=UPI001958A4AB|nr:hypothetical protein [Clostridium sardiniense]MBM7834318.1 hypothetical protein [Clostridium sardiniense]